jgi:hypothetical protein
MLDSQSEEHLLYRRAAVRIVLPIVNKEERLHPKILRIVDQASRPPDGVILIDIHYSPTDETFYVGGASRFSRYYQSNSLEELRAKLERDGWSGPVLIGDGYGPPVHAWDRNGYSGGDWIGARVAAQLKTDT